MSIYLGGSKLQLNLGGTSIREAYLGGVKVLGEVPLPALAANSFRVQFDDSSYDPTVGVWSGNTILTLGWTAVRRRSGIWDLTAPSGTSLRNGFVPFSTNGDNPTSSPWRVLQVNANSSWNDFHSLFNGQPTLEEVPVWNIPVGSDVTYMFVGTSALENGVAWAKKVATTLQVYTTNNTFGNTKYASSIPTDFGGTKGRTRIVSKTGNNVEENLTITLRPGDYIYTACRGYYGSNRDFKSNCFLQLPPSSGTAMANSSQYSSIYLIYARASGSNGAKVTDDTTIRWGYAEGTRMTCTGYRAAYNTNNPYANLYVDSFQFI